MLQFSIYRIDDREGVTPPWLGYYTSTNAYQAVCSCLETHTWIAGHDPHEGNGTDIERVNVREWKRDNRDLGRHEMYNQLVPAGARLYRV